MSTSWHRAAWCSTVPIAKPLSVVQVVFPCCSASGRTRRKSGPTGRATGIFAIICLTSSPFLNISRTTAAFSQYPHGSFTGRSIRTDRYRFTRWTPTKKPTEVAGLELYHHQTDPAENTNVAGLLENAELIKRLSMQLDAGWREAFPADLEPTRE